MSFTSTIYKRYHRSFPTGVIVALAWLATGNAETAHSAVFEQLSSGTVIPMGFVQTDMSTLQEIGGDEYGEPLIARGANALPINVSTQRGSVIEDDPVALSVPDAALRKLVIANVRNRTSLPKPRALSLELSSEQLRMRRLAIDVGTRFANAPGVSRAALDRKAFVALFATMIHRESNFNPRAISPAGAMGLGQLMPATARDLGVCDAFSPRENLEGAATYLTSMLAQFGSPAMALAAYNAGPSAVTRHGGIPPYRETRQYVADIIQAAGQNLQSIAFARASALQTIETPESGIVPIAFNTSTKWRTESGECRVRSGTRMTLAQD